MIANYSSLPITFFYKQWYILLNTHDIVETYGAFKRLTKYQYFNFPFLFQTDDILDDLLSLESSSLASDGFKTSDNSLTGNDLNIKNEPFVYSDAELHALAKDRQKKDNHNMSKYYKYFKCFISM